MPWRANALSRETATPSARAHSKIGGQRPRPPRRAHSKPPRKKKTPRCFARRGEETTRGEISQHTAETAVTTESFSCCTSLATMPPQASGLSAVASVRDQTKKSPARQTGAGQIGHRLPRLAEAGRMWRVAARILLFEQARQWASHAHIHWASEIPRPKVVCRWL